MKAGIRAGQLVRVRQPSEILATLNERGELDSVPFMPEMVPFCGRRFVVTARTERLCDTIAWTGSRTMPDTVLLEDLRCDGSGHGGCAAGCRMYWKTAWLEPVIENEPAAHDSPQDDSLRKLVDLVSQHTTADAAGACFRCQATRAMDATAPLSRVNPSSYLREYRSGNTRFSRFARIMARAVGMELAKKFRLLPDPPLRGAGSTSVRTPRLNLQAGEWVRIRTKAEIEATLNDKGMNKGLWFDREMLPFCGSVFQVRQRIDRIIDERTGEMIELPGDCVSLEGAVCSGERSTSRWFCPRAILPFWREGWLERVEPLAGAVAATNSLGGRVAEAEEAAR